jgi:hypothetical protein
MKQWAMSASMKATWTPFWAIWLMMGSNIMTLEAFAQGTTHVHRLELEQGQVVRLNEQPATKPLRLQVRKGDTLQWTWQSDTPGEWHLHAMRLSGVLQPGQAQSTRFQATASGRFRVEWHGTAGAQSHHAPPLLTLEVRPQ